MQMYCIVCFGCFKVHALHLFPMNVCVCICVCVRVCVVVI